MMIFIPILNFTNLIFQKLNALKAVIMSTCYILTFSNNKLKVTATIHQQILQVQLLLLQLSVLLKRENKKPYP